MSGKIQKHWLIVVLLCGLAASSIGVCSNCVGIFYTPVSDDLGILRGSFAMHATLSSLATAAMAFLTPKLMAVIPYKRLLFFGAALATLSTVGMAFSRQLWLFFVLGILRGVGAGLFANVPVSIILTNCSIRNTELPPASH